MKSLAIVILLTTFLINGCQIGTRNNAQQQTGTKNARVEQTERVQQTAKEQSYNQSPGATAKRLVEIAQKVPNVNNATAIVFGKTAIVGIDINAKLDRPKVGTIKYSVAEALKKDPQGASAIVTADPDIIQRIREMNQDIRNGRPIAGFAEELADIAGRLIPQLPKDISEKKVNPGKNVPLQKPNQTNQGK